MAGQSSRQTGERWTTPLTGNTSGIHAHAEETKLLLEIIANEKRWIVPKEGGRIHRNIAEPRKSAINL